MDIGTEHRIYMDKYRQIEMLSFRVLKELSDIGIEGCLDHITLLQDAYIQYGTMLEEYLFWIEDLLNQPLDTHVRIMLSENKNCVSKIISNCSELCEILYQITVSDQGQDDVESGERLSHDFKRLEGETALIIRFDLLSDSDEDSNDKGLERASEILRETETVSGDYYRVRILLNKSWRRSLPIININDTAIVLQGKIMYEDSFTLDTLYRYRKIYPNTPIIMSTWKGEVKDDFRYFADTINVDILENEYPEYGGRYHLMYQLKSSLEGIKYAKKRYGVKYGLKLRSDQRFYLPEFLELFQNDLMLFPLSKKCGMEERIIFCGGGASALLFPFRLADYWAYGCVNDLINLYSPESIPEMSKNAYDKLWDNVAYENMQVVKHLGADERKVLAQRTEGYYDSEVVIARTFYENHVVQRELSASGDDVLQHYWDFVRECTIIEDSETLLMYWPKYKFKNYEYDCNAWEGNLTHTAWLDFLCKDYK